MKILIISHNPITSYHNMGKTLKALFSSFDKKELCQLYCYPTLPDVDVCNSYFRITDLDVLKSFAPPFAVKSRKVEKNEINSENGMFEHAEDEAKYHVTQQYKRFFRDTMWKRAPWYNQALKSWLQQEKPDCIFVAPGDAEFLYEIALQISKDFSLPIVSYICDDYYFGEGPKDFWGKLRFRKLKKKIRFFFERITHCVYICEEIRSAYGESFGVAGTVLMTGADIVNISLQSIDTASVITYMGNIRCNRYLSLAEIGRTLDKVNQEQGTEYELHVYSGEKDPKILSTFEGIRSVKLCGFVSGQAYEKVFSSADLLLHTEAFDEASVDLVKHSVSTKIAESLASGIPLLAYGPDSVASMRHLIRNNCAIVATSKEELRDALLTALHNREERVRVTAFALRTAQEFHDVENSSKKLREICERVCLRGKA